ncbi:MAG: hypothetical protein AAB535_02305 [Patescibacteria group bacterium]
MIDIRQSINYVNYLKSEGWCVERIEGINYFIKKFPIVGSILKLQRPKKINFNTIDKLCRKYRVFQIILEPDLAFTNGAVAVSKKYHDLLLHKGYKLSKSPYLPTKTMHLDLTRPLKFKKETRRCIRVGEKAKIKAYSSPSEIKLFRDAWKKSVKFNRYVPSFKSLLNLRKSFPDNKSIFLASHNKLGNIIGGALFTRSLHDYGYYWYGFTNKEGRTSLSQYALLHQGILWGKKQSCKIFDMEGIYDDRFPNKSWLGFTHFKKSFGGCEISFPGYYTKFRLPI